MNKILLLASVLFVSTSVHTCHVNQEEYAKNFYSKSSVRQSLYAELSCMALYTEFAINSAHVAKILNERFVVEPIKFPALLRVLTRVPVGLTPAISALTLLALERAFAGVTTQPEQYRNLNDPF